jgi:hypothetical protein
MQDNARVANLQKVNNPAEKPIGNLKAVALYLQP